MPTELLPLITGSGGALIVLAIWVWSERQQRMQAEKRYNDLSEKAIICLTRIVDNQENQKDERRQDEAWQTQVIALLNTIINNA